MYAYIKGVLADVEEESVVVEAGGIGYRIYTTGQTFDYLPAVGEEVKLYTYLNVREDAMILYGFLMSGKSFLMSSGSDAENSSFSPVTGWENLKYVEWSGCRSIKR